jgi:c-di-GMP-binding flagellar brake protein YcgR
LQKFAPDAGAAAPTEGADDSQLKFEVSAGADSGRYLLRSKPAILQVLRDLQRKRSLITLYFGADNDFLVTSVLGIDAQGTQLYVDCGPSKPVNEHVLGSDKLIFIAWHDKVKVQFTAPRAKPHLFDNADAFAVPVPDQLLRLQRREYYRLVAPVVKPLKCMIPLPPGAGLGNLHLNLHDISLGGVSIISHPRQINFEMGARFTDCSIVLPELGTLVTTIEIRNTFEITLANRLRTRRSGFAFTDLTAVERAMIQRYINRLEQERHSRGVL